MLSLKGYAPVVDSEIILVFIALLIFVYISLIRFPIDYKIYRWRWLSGFVLSSIWLLIGVYSWSVSRIENNPNYFTNLNPIAFVIELSEVPYNTNGKFKCTAKIVGIVDSNDTFHKAIGKTVAYFKGLDANEIQNGTRLISKQICHELIANKNPWGFDYSKFLKQNNITHQFYFKNGDFLIIDNESFNLYNSVANFRNHLLNNFELRFKNKSEFGVFAALVLGYKNEIDTQVSSNYVSAGTMHVLAVSGLHIGILYLLVGFLLKPLERTRKLKVLRGVVILLIIWGFALLTGLSPSIKRAATMFSFIVVADAFNRNTNIYNTIAASALFLLVIDPALLMSVGFQLSYLAVLSIVLLYRPIFNILPASNVVLNKIWEILSVSLAAQLAVFPLSIYYFHQFPVYFLLANLVIMPLAGLNLITGIFSVVFYKIPFVGDAFLFTTETGLSWQNGFTEILASLPNATLNYLHFSILTVVLLYVLLAVALLFGFSKSKWSFFSLLFLIISFSGYYAFNEYRIIMNNEVVVFHHSKQMYLNIKLKSNNYTVVKGEIDSSFVKYNIEPYWIENGGEGTIINSDTTIINELIVQYPLIITTTKTFQVYKIGEAVLKDAVVIVSAYGASNVPIDIENEVLIYGRLNERSQKSDFSNSFYCTFNNGAYVQRLN